MMGMFSWETQDTFKSISNKYSKYGTFPVYMHDDKGNVYLELEYEGYGMFGGMDFYKLLANMNNLAGRETAIMYASSNEFGKTIKYPNLSESKDWKWVNEEPKRCPLQGFFY
jgi:hypothetical protein